MGLLLNLALDLTGIAALKKDEPLKVALVRGDRVLASAVVAQHYRGVDASASPSHTAWIPVNFGPITVLGQSGLYRTVDSFQREYESGSGGPPDGGAGWGWIWTNRDLLAKLDTTWLADQQHVARLVAYTKTATGLIPRVMTACAGPGGSGPTELLPLAIDNRALTAWSPGATSADVAVEGLMRNGVDLPFFGCQRVEVKQGDEIVVRVRATDPGHHLGSFDLVELHRIGCSAQLSGPATLASAGGTAPAQDTYGARIAAAGEGTRPVWNGGSYWVKVKVGAPPPATASCNDCGADRPFFPWSGAYNLRLGVYKRVTNGYWSLFYTESNALIVIHRTDAP